MSFRIHRWHHHRKMLAGALAMLFSLALAVSAPLTSYAAGWLTDTGSDWKNAASYTMNPAAWTTSAASLPVGLTMSQTAVIGSYVYLFGGVSPTTPGNNILRAPVSNPTAWVDTGATLPTHLFGSQVAVIGSYIYLFGGADQNGPIRSIYRAPTSDPLSWADTGAVLPVSSGVGVSSGHLAIIGNYVYIFGGSYYGFEYQPMNLILRAPLSDPLSWVDTGAHLPANLAGGSLAVIGNYVYLFGGATGSYPSSTAIYRASVSDPITWTNTGAVLPSDVRLAELVLTNDYVYLLGGAVTSGTANMIYRAPVSDPLSWVATGQVLPASLHSPQVAVINGVAYLFGGDNGSLQGSATILSTALTVADLTPPTPNPMTFSVAPDATTTTKILMTATTATDAAGSDPVSYLFPAAPCATNGGTGYTSSAWQTGTSYQDTGLAKNQCYSYAVVAKDAAGNIGSPSATSSIYTRASPPTAPTFSYVSDHSYAITNNENGNPSNTTFAMQVQTTSPTDSTWNAKYIDAAGNPSSSAVWLSDATWDTVIMQNLVGGTTYAVRAIGRNGDNINTGWSATTNVTGATTPAPPMTGTPLTGYGWSDTTGWISLNCTNTDTCSTSNYGVYIQSDGTLTGYAWSDTVGWIQFGGLSSFPTGGGTTAANATLIGSTALTGWARACAGTVGGDCSSMTSRTDGWDGWIALSGTSYGPTLSSGSLTGYSWGDTNVGWILWNAATTYQPCQTTSGYQCVGNDSVYTAPSCAQTTDICTSHGTGWFCSSDNHLCTAPPAPSYTNSSGELTARPSLVKGGATTKLSWSVQDASTCTVSGNGDSWTGVTSASSNCATKTGTMCVTAPITDLTTYTLHCVGDGGTLDGSATITLIPSWRER